VKEVAVFFFVDIVDCCCLNGSLRWAFSVSHARKLFKIPRLCFIWCGVGATQFSPNKLTNNLGVMFACVISDFRRGVKEIVTLLGCYAADTDSNRRFRACYQSHLQGSRFLTVDSWSWDR
jgi:hypothetical protein